MKNNPYIGPQPFERKDSRNFFGRDREERDLLSLILAERVVLFYAQSGAGKTSLLNTRIIPALEQEGFQVLPIVRVGSDPPPEIEADSIANIFVFSALMGLAGAQVPAEELREHTLTSFLKQALSSGKGDLNPPILILDQFEEVLTSHRERWQQVRGFFEQLQEALREMPQLGVVFAMREDHIAGLDPYAQLLPRRLKARYRMELLGIEGAREAIRRPAENSKVPFDQGVAERLVDDLRRIKIGGLGSSGDGQPTGEMEATVPGPYIEPVQLQVVCRRLWENLPEQIDECITWDEVEQFGDVDLALTDFYESALVRAMEATEVSERKVRRWFGQQLITSVGTRGLVLRGESDSGGLPNAAVDELERRHIIRGEARAGARWYELAHDRLVDPILRSNRRWEEARQTPLRKTAQMWAAMKNPDLLFRGEALSEAWDWAEANPDEVEPYEREFLEAGLQRQAKEELELTEKAVRLEAAEKLAAMEKQRADEQAAEARRFRRLLMLVGFLLLAAVLSAAGAAVLFREIGNVRENLFQSLSTAQAARSQSAAYQATAAAAFTTAEAVLQSARAAEEQAATAVALADTQRADATAVLATSQALEVLADARSLESNQRLASLLALLAQSFQVDNPELSALLAVEAFRRLDSGNSRSLLLERLQRTSELELSVYSPAPPDQPFQVTSIAFSPESAAWPGRQALAWGRLDGTVVLWDAEQGAPIAERTRHTQRISSIAFSPDGQYMASAALDRQIYIWELEQIGDENYRPPAIRSFNPVALAFSANSTQLAAGAGATLFIYDAETRLEELYKDYELYPISVAWNPSQPDQIAAADSRGPWKVWETLRGEQVSGCGIDCPSGVNHLAWSPDGELLAAGGSNGDILLYAMPEGRLADTLSKAIGHKHDVSGLAFSHDGRHLASSGLDRQLIVWDVARRTPVIQRNLGIPLLGVAFALDSGGPNLLATIGGDDQGGKVFLFEALPSNPLYGPADPGEAGLLPGDVITLPGTDSFTGEEVSMALEAAGISTPPASLAIDAAEKLVAVGGQGGGLQVVDLEEHQIRLSDPGVPQADALAFSPSNHLLASSHCILFSRSLSGCGGSVVELRDPVQGRNFHPPVTTELDGSIEALAFHPDGAWLFAGQEDGLIVKIDVTTGEKLQSWQSLHLHGVSRLAFGPDAKLLVSAGKDGRLALWFGDSLLPVGAPLTGAAGAIRSLRFDSTGKLVYSAEADGTILKWDVDPESWADRNCQQAGRSLTPEEWEQYLPGEQYRPDCQFP